MMCLPTNAKSSADTLCPSIILKAHLTRTLEISVIELVVQRPISCLHIVKTVVNVLPMKKSLGDLYAAVFMFLSFCSGQKMASTV